MIRKLLSVLMLSLLLAGGGAAGLWWWSNQPMPLDGLEVEIARGKSMRQVAERLEHAGVTRPALLIEAIARIDGVAGRMRAGTYRFDGEMTIHEVLAKIARGEVVRVTVTVPEGWTYRQMRALIESVPDLVQDTLTLDDAQLLNAVEAPYEHPEGLFFPDTYVVDKNASALSVFRAAHLAMMSRLDAAWAERAPELPLASPYEALVLASIIEKETGRADERGLVGSVFINRLRARMRLQTDPTVIYGLDDDFDGRLRKRHLQTDHPWNTYTRDGLPPTPIALPGAASLAAALRPQDSDYYYFVARGDGTSKFSRHLAEHNRAVNRYQR